MGESFSIKSVQSDAELVFTGFDDDYFTVELRGHEVTAALRVWGYTDCQLLVDCLDYLAKNQNDSCFPAKWASIESDFALGFRCDALGHVTVEIKLSQLRGAEDWTVKGEIETELGQLPRIAANAARFFQCVPGS